MSMLSPDHELLRVATLALSVNGPDGAPHTAPVYFAALPAEPSASGPVGNLPACPWNLAFFSSPDSLHARCLAADPRAAAAIYPETPAWEAIRGLQLHGRVRSLAPFAPGPSSHSGEAERSAAWLAYQSKFPFVADLQALIARSSLHIFTPIWIRLIDNRQGFGFRQEQQYV